MDAGLRPPKAFRPGLMTHCWLDRALRNCLLMVIAR
jgi:hypothetical protein